MPRSTPSSSSQSEAQPLIIPILRAAELLSMSRRSVERLIAAGELQAVGIGRLRRVLTRSLHDYIEKHAVQSERHA